jgi:hypothetical protein
MTRILIVHPQQLSSEANHGKLLLSGAEPNPCHPCNLWIKTFCTLLCLMTAWATGLFASDVQSAPAAPSTHVLIVSGLSGEPQFAVSFQAAASQVFDAAKSRWGVADSNLVYLAEDPAKDPARIKGRASRDEVAAAFGRITRRSNSGDLVLILLIGHGSGQGAESRLSLPGPDPSAADFAGWLKPLAGRTTVLVNAATGSGDFVEALAGAERLVITATKSAFERNESVFAEIFVKGLTGDADADKDGRVSMLEAFQYARSEVAKRYQAKGLLQTEHAQVSDSSLARTIALETSAAPTDPKIASLVAERRALEAQVDALRRKKATMDSTAYERDLEALLLQIAQKTAAIKAAQEGRP